MTAAQQAGGSAADPATDARVRALLQEHLPGYEPDSVVVVEGDPGVLRIEVDGTLFVEIESDDDVVPRRLSPAVEATLLRSLGGLLDVPVPVPVFQQDDPGVRAFRMSPGRPLPPQGRSEQGPALRLARRLGGVLADLHGVDASDTGADLPIAGGPESYRSSAARAWAAHSPAHREGVDPVEQERVAAFLREPAPGHPPHPALCHLDLRPANILLDGTTSELAGIRGWSRAAVGDPARDLCVVLLYLGEAPLEAALDGYRRAGAVTDDDPNLVARIVFHARCAAIADPDPSVARSAELWQ